ncbi:MAG: glycine cleavage system protein GcvH [Candidatus Micrarchaeia archaeon]
MKFTKEHEWVEIREGLAVVGITDFAQKALGDIVSLELPKVGAKFKQGDSIAVVDSMKASSDVYAPVSGEVVEVNTELLTAPQLVNESPYEKGWMVKLKPSDLKELDKLMDEKAYEEYTKSAPRH